MKKYFILFVLIYSCCMTAYGQLIMHEMNADGEVTYPVTTISRAEFLSLSSDLQNHPERFIINDLINGENVPKESDGKIYLYVSQYNSFSGERKRQVLLHPEQYVVIADESKKPATIITELELGKLSPEKQTVIRNSPEYKIVK